MMEPARADASSREAAHRRLIHRENIQLGVLIVVAVAAFLVTRAIATSNRRVTLSDAAAWYARGEVQMRNGQTDDAVDSFRRAAARKRGDTGYVLALAKALTVRHDYDAARAALLDLRDLAPDDPAISLQLARLAVEREDVTEAVRFY